MKYNNLNGIYEILKQDKRLINDNNELLKNKVQELTLKTDNNLLKLLLNNDLTKELFFIDVDGIFVFDKNKFMWVIDSKDFLPDSYTAYKNKIMLTDEKGNSIKNGNDVVLSFPCKDCLVEMDSTEDIDERNEVFFNEILMKSEIDTLLEPKVFTNIKKYSKDKEEIITTIEDKDNLIIKGNNLLTLYSLLPRYAGKIKLMYWDILYNTDSDKVPYNDSFKHSSWLTMMKNRLEVAKKLLKTDGVICLQCDDNEMAYLKVLCDEIFKRENFLNCIAVKMSEPTGMKMAHADLRLPKLKEYILLYKNTAKIKLNRITVPKDKWDSEYKTFIDNITKEEVEIIKSIRDNENRTNEDVKKCDELLSKIEYHSVNEEYKKNNITSSNEKDKFNFENSWRIIQTVSMSGGAKKLADEKKEISKSTFYSIVTPKKKMYIIKGDYNVDISKPRIKILFADDYLTVNPCDFWQDIKTTGLDNEGTVDLKNGKKPERLIQRIIDLTTNKGDIVLDAYLGSGTTTAVAHKMGRQYIGIEQLNSHIEKSLIRMKNVLNGEQTGISKNVNWNGGGEFVYCELASNSEEFIEKVVQASDNELLFLYEQIKENDFISYRVDINKLEGEKNGFINLSIEDKRKFLINIVDKNTLYINYSDMNDITYKISEGIKKFNNSFYKKEV